MSYCHLHIFIKF